MRLALITTGLLVLAGCAETHSDVMAPDGFTVSADPKLVEKVSAETGPTEGQRVVKLPAADVTVRNVTAFNGAYPNATAIAREACIQDGLDARRISDRTADGFVQFNCVPFRGPS